MANDFSKQIHHLPVERRQRIFRIRRQITEGTYETREKLELAVSRMVESFDSGVQSSPSESPHS